MARLFSLITLMVTALLLWTPQRAWACPVCFGDPNSPMAIGASWGIALLLGVTLGVLAVFAGFFLYLLKRSRMALGERIELSRSSQASGSV
ncbi:MAG: hypothetical protein VX453_06070 [Acidobacteriota bacterium]|nr:hypothetical protein [Acidobacteriota bacterium]